MGIWGEGLWGEGYWNDFTVRFYDGGRDTQPSSYDFGIYDWGTDTWGDTPLFGSRIDDVDTYVHNNTRETWENLDNEALTAKREDPLYNLIHTLQRDTNRFDEAIRQQYEGLFISTANGEFLERIGQRYGLHRRSGETDQKFRRRIKARIGAITSTGTFDDFAAIVLFVLDAEPDEVRLIPPSESDVPATVKVQTSTDTLSETDFTEAEIVGLLEDAVAAGGRVQLQADGTFQFDGDGFTPDPNTGFDEGTFGGSY